MNLGKLTKRLRREATANPKKAAMLGLLALVAGYFWAPLVIGWMKKAEPIAVASSAPASPLPTSDAAKPPAPGAAPQMAWHEMLRAVETDPRMQAIDLLPSWRDPFALAKPAQIEKPKELAVQAAPKVTPSSLGLALAGTVIGEHRRVARLSGRSYEEGQTIEVLKDGRSIVFTLAEVHPRHIVLSRGGEKFELSIPSPNKSGKIEVTDH